MVATGDPCDFIEKCEECGLVFQVIELICENDGSAHGIVMKTAPNYLEELDLLCSMKCLGSLDVGTSSILKSWECSNCKQRTYSENLPYYCQNCGMEVRR